MKKITPTSINRTLPCQVFTMQIVEFKHLMESAVTSFRSEATDPERWSDLPKATQLVRGLSGIQTSEARPGVLATRLYGQWLHG